MRNYLDPVRNVKFVFIKNELFIAFILFILFTASKVYFPVHLSHRVT